MSKFDALSGLVFLKEIKVRFLHSLIGENKEVYQGVPSVIDNFRILRLVRNDQGKVIAGYLKTKSTDSGIVIPAFSLRIGMSAN